MQLFYTFFLSQGFMFKPKKKKIVKLLPSDEEKQKHQDKCIAFGNRFAEIVQNEEGTLYV